MPKLDLIPPTHIDVVWENVVDFLNAALVGGYGEVTIDQLKMMLLNGQQHLITISDDNGLIGAVTIEFQTYPNKRIALGTTFGGRGIATLEVLETLKSWCRSMGASEFRTYAKEAQARLYRRIGFQKQYNVVGVSL